MEPTRIDSAKLKTAVAKAEKKVDEALAELASLLVVMTDADRASVPRTLDGFGPAARQFAQAMKRHPDIAAAVNYDREAVIEDLDNADTLTALAARVGELQRRLADSKLEWLAEAWSPSLAAYAVAQAAARSDGALRDLIAPLAAVFATRRNRRPKPAPTAK